MWPDSICSCLHKVPKCQQWSTLPSMTSISRHSPCVPTQHSEILAYKLEPVDILHHPPHHDQVRDHRPLAGLSLGLAALTQDGARLAIFVCSLRHNWWTPPVNWIQGGVPLHSTDTDHRDQCIDQYVLFAMRMVPQKWLMFTYEKLYLQNQVYSYLWISTYALARNLHVEWSRGLCKTKHAAVTAK